ncbi:MAG: hypothetical protein ACSHX0_06855 [Akkermansiaceae bacterium]
MIKSLLLSITDKGEVKSAKVGIYSTLRKEVRSIKSTDDFPKGISELQVWTKANGLVKKVSKSKLLAQAKHDDKVSTEPEEGVGDDLEKGDDQGDLLESGD